MVDICGPAPPANILPLLTRLSMARSTSVRGKLSALVSSPREGGGGHGMQRLPGKEGEDMPVDRVCASFPAWQSRHTLYLVRECCQFLTRDDGAGTCDRSRVSRHVPSDGGSRREGSIRLTRPGRRRGRRLVFPGRLSSPCAGPLRLSVVLRHVVCLNGTLAGTRV